MYHVMLLFSRFPFFPFPSSLAGGYKYGLLTLALSLSQKTLQLDNIHIRPAYIISYDVYPVLRRVHILA